MGDENNAIEKESKGSVQSVELLEELIEEILSRLPAKSLLRFRCVSQSWCCLIGNKRFIENHLQKIARIKSYTHWRTLFNCPTIHGLMQRSMQSYCDEPSLDPSPFNDPKNNHLTTKGVHVVDHCNGVLCIQAKPGSFFLWNPTTRISIGLPKIKAKNMKYGFGWDDESDAYKVFVGLSRRKNIGKVYSTKTNSWKLVEFGSLSLCTIAGKFVSGKIYWLIEGGLRIEFFDLKTEGFGMVENPYKPEVGVSLGLCSHLGCLAVLVENKDNKTRRLWVMNEYGAKGSWVQVNNVPAMFPTRCCLATLYYIESLVSLEYVKE